MKHLILGFLLAALPAFALADAPQMYKWTDADGVVHYSDKPPVEAVADMQTLDIPQLPPVDPEKAAAEQAALTTQLAALEKLLNARDLEQAQARALAAQKAELEAEMAALQQQQSQEPEAVPVIYSTSQFVPRIYRRNHYRFHRNPPQTPFQWPIGKPKGP